jgi:hypothetical protein
MEERRDVGMSGCRDVGMSGCRDVGMLGCRDVRRGKAVLKDSRTRLR